MAYFDGIKVGDTIWVAGIGWIDVGRVSANGFEVLARFHSLFNFNGVKFWETLQTAFWSEPKFEIPPRTKRKLYGTVKSPLEIIGRDCDEFIVITHTAGKDVRYDYISTIKELIEKRIRIKRMSGLYDFHCTEWNFGLLSSWLKDISEEA